MATYVNDLRLKEIATGDEAGTWGTSTNTNLELIAEAFSFGTEAITTNADTHTTTIADGSTDPGRSLFLKYTGTLDSTCTITIGPNTVSKLWFIENATSGSQSIIIKQGSGATVTIANGQTKAIYSDGAGSGAAMVDAFTDLSVPSFFVSGDLDVDGTANLDVVDIDGAVDMASTLQVDGAITSSAGATITTADNATTLNLVSTDTDANAGPHLRLSRNVTGADNDALGQVEFSGRDDAGNDFIYAQIEAYIIDASNGSEDGYLEIFRGVGGTERVSAMVLSSTATVFNENSSDIDFRVESDGNTHMLFVDAGNNRVGIANSSPAAKLDIVEATSTTAVKIKSGTSTNQNTHITMLNDNDGGTLSLGVFGSGATTFGTITATDGFITSNQELCLNSQNASGAIKFGVGSTPTERMRIDSSGNLLVGKTGTGDYVTGFEVQPAGAVLAYRTNGVASIFGRTNNGEITRFTSNSQIVGSIGVLNNNNLRISGDVADHGGLQFGTHSVVPMEAGSDSDGTIDLGASAARFKDLYLSGGVNFSANSNAAGMTSELLDDYEEGTFTPAFVSPGTGAVHSIQIGTYTKVGRLVTASVYLQLSTVGTGAGNISVSGFPFATSTGANDRYSGTGAIHGTSWAADTGGLQGLIAGQGATSVTMYKNMCAASGTTFLPTHADMGGGNLLFTISYFAS